MIVKIVCFSLVVACAVAGRLRAKPSMTIATENSQNIMDLDGSASTGNIVKYEWKLLNSIFEGHTIDGHSRAAFKTTAGGVFKWQLKVCDAKNHCNSKVIKSPEFKEITDNSGEELLAGPTAIAHVKISKQGTEYTIDLDASASKDDKGIKSYKWQMVQGDNNGLTYTTAQATYITENAGVYRWHLEVCDTDDLCSSAAVVGVAE